MCILPIGRIFVIASSNPFNCLADLGKGSFPKPFASLGLFWCKLDALVIWMQV